MKHFALLFILIAAFWGSAPTNADACTVAASTDGCKYFDPTGQRPSGTLDLPLDQEVTVCHPNFRNLHQGNGRGAWFSYAIYVDGQLSQLVNELRRSGSWSDEVELAPGQSCHERYAASNWNFAVFDPCVVEGYNVLRVAPDFRHDQTLDDFSEWPTVNDEDGKPLLFAL